MAGFARLVVAAETALGFKAGEFMAAYQENLTEGVMAAIDASPVAQALIEFMHGRQEWTGTAKQLLDAITPGSIDPGSPPRGWPVFRARHIRGAHPVCVGVAADRYLLRADGKARP